MIVGSGLNYDFMMAWKSGKKPSAMRDKTITPSPRRDDGLVNDNALGSNILKIAIPRVAIKATNNFFLPSFKVISLTPVNKTPTKTTDSTPQERIIMTTGKLVNSIAYE